MHELLCNDVGQVVLFQQQPYLPFIPKIGPCEGCLIQANVFFFKWADMACEIPIVVVLFPSPSGVGVILNMKYKMLATEL